MSHIEITRPDPETGGTRVTIDGVNMSHSITHLDAEFTASRPPRVTIDLLLVEDQALCMPDAELIIDSASVDLLERHGWTRPGVKA